MLLKAFASLSVSAVCVFSTAAFAQTYDGSWKVSESVDATACAEGKYTDTYTATVKQTGNQMSVTANGISRSGTLTGNSLRYSVSFEEEGGINTGAGTIVFSGNTATGNSSWSWTNGSFTCAGTSSITANRVIDTTPEPTPKPRPEVIAPKISYLLTGRKLDINWSPTETAKSYTLFYAPYPSATPILTMELGQALAVSGELSVNDSFYIAVQANLADGQTLLSNIENFKVTGVDIIEVNNTSSDISAIVVGDSGSSLVTFNSASSTYAMLDLNEGRLATMRGETSGQLTELVVEGFTAKINYGLGTKQITITSPDGTESMLSAAYLSQALEAPACFNRQNCQEHFGTISNLADEDVSKYERLLDDSLDIFRRISTVAFCSQPIGIPTCNVVEGFVEKGQKIKDRLSNRLQYNVNRISNALTCTVSLEKCGQVASKQVPTLVQQINVGETAAMPNAGFNIGAEKVVPKEEWRDYLTKGSITMTDVPCSESVFADMRPDCEGSIPNTGGSTGAPSKPEIDPNFDSVAARCWDTAADFGCVNADEFPVGIHKHYGDVNSARYLQIHDDYNGLSLTRTRYFPSGAVSSTVNFIYTGSAEKLDGYWAEDGISKAYYEDGTLKLSESYKLSLRDGPSKFYNENGVINHEGNYKAGKLDGEQNSYVNGKLVSTQVYSNGVKVSSSNL